MIQHTTRKDQTIYFTKSKTSKRLLLILSSLCCLSSLSARILTDANGKTIEAELLAIHKDQVSFKRLDTNTIHTLPLEQFSLKDQQYILEEKNAKRLTVANYTERHSPSVAPVTKVQDHFKWSREIDKLLAKHWQEKGVQPSPHTDDATFLRRAYLRIIGRIPTHAEAVHFLKNNNPHKRSDLVDKLLDSQGYVSHNFNLWADVLRARSTGQNGTRHGGVYYVPWIKEQIRYNVPYDQFVRKLLTAEGYPWDNPAVGYYLRDFGMPLDNMSMTAQIFLGTQMQCAQCHNHPTDGWTQKDFYGLAAYTYGLKTGRGPNDIPEAKKIMAKLREASIELNGGKLPNGQQASPMRAGREFFDPLRWGVGHTKRDLKLPHDYQYSDGEPGDVIKPKVLFGDAQSAQLHDSVSKVDSYADWMVGKNNERFTTVIANRMWKHAMGKGLIEPVDNLTDDSVADSPELMAYLEKLMRSLNYDLKQFQRVLYNTQYFQRQAVIDNPDKEDDYHLEGPVFQRMTPEQIWDSLATLMTPEIDSRLTYNYTGRNQSIVYQTAAKPAPVKMLEEMTPQQMSQYIIDMSEVYKEFHETRTALAKIQRDPDYKGTQELKQAQAKAREARTKWYQLLDPKEDMPNNSGSTGSMADFPGYTVQLKKNKGKKSNLKWLNSIRRASELPSPAPRGHLLEIFGQSDRMLIENSDDDGNVLQALFLMNSPQTNGMLAHSSAPVIEARLAKTPAEKLETLYIGFLARKPTQAEMEALTPYLAKNPEKGREQIIWAMLNTQQFLFIQ